MLKKFGKSFTMELKRKQMGMKHMEAIQFLLDEMNLNDVVTAEEYAKEYDQILESNYPNAKALPSAQKLVEHLTKHGIETAICTGSCSRTFALKAAKHRDWVDLVPIQVLTGDDPNVKKGKPAPDGFLYTMSKFEKAPESSKNVLVFEDAPNGVEAALAANMQCVMVPDPQVFVPDNDFKKRVDLILNSLEEFLPESFGLPPY
ncbi:unnamed protein product [Auanema sp. JU1783]|nr:unnamed protein product [Auanema sp. JU1783]